MLKKILIIGPAHPLRGGGMTTFNQRLAKEFTDAGYECSICSYSLQYPSLFFPGSTQYTDEPPPEGIKIRSLINSINPHNWINTGNLLKKERHDIVIVRYWIPFLGPALGTILRKIKKNHHSKIICIADNIIPHEKRFGDKIFTRYFLKPCDAFVTMSGQVKKDLFIFEKSKPVKNLYHPVYDNFGAPVSKTEARNKLGLDPEDRIILFFGFIRRYKGLDILLETIAGLNNIKLMIAGEFYDDKEKYRQLMEKPGIRDKLILKTEFIPSDEIRNYFCAADVVVQPYRTASQSGVTPLACYYEKPVIVTNVGGLPDMVINEKTGIIAEPEHRSLADAVSRFYELGENHFIPHLRNEKEKLGWTYFMNAIIDLAGETGQDKD